MLSLAGKDIADMAWEVKCREEDMKQRALENERKAIDDTRRAVDEKAQQLKTLSHQSALIAGFSMIALVEIEIPKDLNPIVVITFGCTSAITVCSCLFCMLQATFMLVAIFRYDVVTREVPFSLFWCRRCESDWYIALRAFGLGVPLFMVSLAQTGWIVFWNISDDVSRIISSICVSVIGLLTVIVYLGHPYRKWIDWLLVPETKLQNPEA